MTNSLFTSFTEILETLAETLTTKFAASASFNPEDQLKGPVADLFQQMGNVLGLSVVTVTEVQVGELRSRPDLGVLVGSLLTGHVELKAPGKGANPARFRLAAHLPPR